MKKDSQKRELEPTFTRGYVRVAGLRDKLEWLYGHHPIIKAQYQLAKELGVSPATLSTWLNGTRYTDTKTIATSNPDSIPTKHYRDFVDLWGLPEAVLEIEDIDEFKNALATFEAGRSPWEKLIRSLPDNKIIEIITNSERGIVDPDDEEDAGIPHLSVHDEVILRVPNPGLRHGALLVQDRSGWSSLRPNPRWRETSIESELVFPRQIEDGLNRFARLDSTAGIHRVLAIFTEEPLPGGVLEILMSRPMDVSSLNHAVGAFQSRLAGGSAKCQMFSRRFLVTPNPPSKARSGGAAAPH